MAHGSLSGTSEAVSADMHPLRPGACMCLIGRCKNHTAAIGKLRATWGSRVQMTAVTAAR